MRRAEVIALRSPRRAPPLTWAETFARRIDIAPETRAAFVAGIAFASCQRRPLIEHLPASRWQIARQVGRDALNLPLAALRAWGVA
jgi:hypothetical protein